MKKRTGRNVALATLLAATLLLTACQNLPKRVAGQKCPLVGEHAQDGTWVLKCAPNKRWTRLMTIADANDAVATWLRSQAPATTPPTTPPAAAAATTFGPTNSAVVADRAGGIKPGTYVTRPDGTYCSIEIFGGATRRRFGKAGPMYIDLAVGDWIKTVGSCRWNLGPVGTQAIPSSGDGMYRVRTEIQPGLYTAPGSSECYWETATNANGSLAAITDLYYGPGPQLVEITGDDAYFVSDDCGPWTALNALPAKFLVVASDLDNYPLQGLRAFYQAGQFTVTPGTTQTQIVTPSFTATIAAPDGGSFSNGTFTVSRYPFPAPGNVLLDITSPGRGCNAIPGTAVVSDVVLDGGGVATSMHIVALAECDGKRFGLNLEY